MVNITGWVARTNGCDVMTSDVVKNKIVVLIF